MHYHFHCGSVHQDHVDRRVVDPLPWDFVLCSSLHCDRHRRCCCCWGEGVIADITSIWSPLITNLHIMLGILLTFHVHHSMEVLQNYSCVMGLLFLNEPFAFETAWNCHSLNHLKAFVLNVLLNMSCQGVQESFACSETQKVPYDA